MKKPILIATMLALFHYVQAQVILFQDNFESGAGNWTLNGGTGSNAWVLNNVYTGGLFGLIIDTPSQPAGISGSPSSNYLHITNGDICSIFSICNANFDTGSPSDQSATLTNSISTLALQNVSISFYYLCAGAAGTSFGTLEYSADNGSTWTTAATYSGVSTWTQAIVTLPQWDNLPSLMFRFRWQNGGSGSDPAFSVDDVLISATSVATPVSIVLDPIADTSWCYNTLFHTPVHFTSSGTFYPGNVYTAELSDASGSFASPLAIGTLASGASGNLTINGVIPAGTASGAGYRIRVVSSDQPAQSNDNGSDLHIRELPPVNAGDDITACAGTPVTLTASGAQLYLWTNSVINASPFVPAATTTYTVTGTDAYGCQGTDQLTVTVDPCLGLDENATTQLHIYPNPVSTSFRIQLPGNEQSGTLYITDLTGRILKSYPVYSLQNPNLYSMEDLPAGNYLLLFHGAGFHSTGIIKY